MNRCPECGGSGAEALRQHRIEYKGESTEVELAGWFCDDCDEVILQGGNVAKYGDAYATLKDRVDNLKPHAVREIRERLGLSQRKAGVLFGGGARAFQRYESGEETVSRALSHLLRLLANDPTRLKEIQ